MKIYPNITWSPKNHNKHHTTTDSLDYNQKHDLHVFKNKAKDRVVESGINGLLLGTTLGTGTGTLIGHILGRKHVKREQDRAELLARLKNSKGVKNRLLNILDKKRLDKIGKEARNTVDSKKLIRKDTLSGLGIGAGSGGLIGASSGALYEFLKGKKATQAFIDLKNLENKMEENRSDINNFWEQKEDELRDKIFDTNKKKFNPSRNRLLKLKEALHNKLSGTTDPDERHKLTQKILRVSSLLDDLSNKKSDDLDTELTKIDYLARKHDKLLARKQEEYAKKILDQLHKKFKGYNFN